MKKIQIIIEQLEVSKKLIKKNTEGGLRMSLLLLDNAIEILMYRRIMDEFRHSDFYKQLSERIDEVPESSNTKKLREEFNKNIIPNKEMKQIENYFPEKAKFLSDKKIIESEVAGVLVAIHRYRNEAYHNDKLRKGSIKSAVKLLYEISCDLLQKLDTKTRTYNGEEMDELKSFFSKYDSEVEVSLFNIDMNGIVKKLKSSMHITKNTLKRNLRNHIEERFKETKDLIKFIEDNAPGDSAKEVLPDYPKKFKELELKLKDFDSKINRLALFSSFIEIESIFEPFELDIKEKADSLDEFIQFQIDLARGK